MNATFKNSDPEKEEQNRKSWDFIRLFMDSDYRGVYLWGPCGTGKSFAAYCVMSQVEKKERTAKIITSPEFVRTMRLFSPGEILNVWKSATLWILDDIDKGNWKPDTLRSLWEVLDARMRPWQKTIITGNVIDNELRAYLTRCAEGDETLVQSIMQRLHPIQVLEFSGKSLR